MTGSYYSSFVHRFSIPLYNTTDQIGNDDVFDVFVYGTVLHFTPLPCPRVLHGRIGSTYN